MAFKVFPCGANKIPLIRGWQEAATTDPAQLELWRQLFKDKLAFFGVPTGPTNGILALDVDTKGNGFETLKSLPLPDTMSQRTPSGGAHYLFRYPNDGRHYGNRVKFKPGLDSRGAGGYICWYGGDSKPLADPPLWMLEDAVKPAPQVQGTPIAVDPSIAEKVIKASIDAIREAPDGERNNTLNVEAFKVGQLVASGSVSREYAEIELLKAAVKPGESDYHPRATIRSALNGGALKPLVSPFGTGMPQPMITIPAPPVVTRWTPAQFTREDLLNTKHLRRPQLFENWSTEDIHITTADGGTGKSTLKLYESVCLALGQPFLGFPCLQPGRTLYITGEDSDKKLGAMIGQILRQMGLLNDFPGFAEKVNHVLQSIVVKKDSDLTLIVKDQKHFIHPCGDAFRKVMQAVEDIKPKMIVFDPISCFWGSENALNDMNRAVTKFMSRLAEESGACVEMINHMGKSSSANKDMTQFAGRGGSGLPSNSRVSRVLRPVFEDEYTELTGESLADKQSAMMCVVNKFTDGSPLYNKPFLILRDGFIFTRKNLSDIKQREAEKSLSDVERVFGFIKEQRSAGKYPSQNVAVGHFMTCGDPLSEARTKRALTMLQYEGWMGEKLQLRENPDVTIKEKVFVITDLEGKEH